MAKITWAPDGVHFSVCKKGSIGKLWDFFNGPEIAEALWLNRRARFILFGDAGKRVGELPRKTQEVGSRK